MKYPVLFSDIDQTLSSDKWFQKQDPLIIDNNKTISQEEKLVDPKCMTQLNRILEETNAKIVISSHIRLWQTLDQIKQIFIKGGLKKKFEDRIISKTPLVGAREDDIKHWVKNHEEEISNWAVIDDKQKKEFKNVKEHFVHINPQKGLTIKRADKVIKILNQS